MYLRTRLFALLLLSIFGAGAICVNYKRGDVTFRAPVKVTKGGLYAPGVLVDFKADKLGHDGSPLSNTQLTAQKFTDFLGQTDWLFGYSLDYDPETMTYAQGASVTATVNVNGVDYHATASRKNFPVDMETEILLDTLRLALPAD